MHSNTATSCNPIGGKHTLQAHPAFRKSGRPLLLATLALAIGCVFGGGSALAEGFTYHGNLEQAGAPASGSFDLKLTLYSAEQGGQVLAGPFEAYDVGVSDGAFSTQVDFGPLGDFDRTAWLGVEVKAGSGDYEPLAGRSAVKPMVNACPGSWSVDGNAGNPAGSFLGTADNDAVLFKTNNKDAILLIPKGTSDPAVSLSPWTTNAGVGSTSVSYSSGADGKYSFAGGYYGKANHDHSFVWNHADSAERQFVIGARGGVGINMSPEVESASYHRSELSIKSNGSGNAGNKNLSVIKLVSGTGMSASVSVDKDGMLSLYPSASTANMTIGKLAGTGTIFVANNMGVRRVPATNAFEVNGNASKSTAGSWLANSDARIKQDIQPISGALDTLARLNPVTFRYTDTYRAEHEGITDQRYYNVIAQEFAEVFPDAVQGSGEYLDGAAKTADNEILQVDTYPALITTVAAVQELAAENALLHAENAELRAQFKSLSERVDRLAVRAGR